MKRFDTANEYVVYTSTFSKPLLAGLKTGYALMPPDLVEPLLHLKGSHDFGSTNLAQHIIDRLMATGAYAPARRELAGRVPREAGSRCSRPWSEEFADCPG